MDYILKYFWSIGLVFAVLNAFALKSQLPKAETEEALTEQKRFVIGYCLFFAIPCLLLQIFQLLGSYRLPLYILFGDFSNPFYWCGVCSLFLTYVAALIVVITYRNIEKYSQYLFRKNRTPLKRTHLILIMIGIIVFASILIFFVAPTMLMNQ